MRIPALSPDLLAVRAVIADFLESTGGDGNPVTLALLRREELAAVAAMAESDAERAAAAADPRPGRWYGEAHADGRALSQRETDILIRAELFRRASRIADALALQDQIGEPARIEVIVRPVPHALPRKVIASMQRGGIDIDPLVRLFAWRAWGDRDGSPYWGVDRGVDPSPGGDA